MKFLMDLVHHNPGEEPFVTSFTDANKLCEYGYNAQVFKHINCVITFDVLDNGIFPSNETENAWYQKTVKRIEFEIAQAKAAGLLVFYHIDLFLLPLKLVKKLEETICDNNNKISLAKEETLRLHTLMFDELFRRFPQVDGLIIRVGETYLYDTPFHTGCSPICWDPLQPSEREKQEYIKLIIFLKHEICEKHQRYLIFRTWDCFPDRFHSNPDYYLNVTNQIEPHNKLIFSIKHTKRDFFRYAKFNECLTRGKHQQIVEVQCQREYEGKGAYPNYVMDKVINGYPEDPTNKGLKHIINNPLIVGVFTWSRGGGWYGPYLKHEFWCDINTYTISHFTNAPHRSEEDIFNEYCREKMELDEREISIFRDICLLSSEAILKGRYCCQYDYDKLLHGDGIPTDNWMRDDRIGGSSQLEEVFKFLVRNNLVKNALEEKREAVDLWQTVRDKYALVSVPDVKLNQAIGTSIEYGYLLFKIVLFGWEIMLTELSNNKSEQNEKYLENKLAQYREAWEQYQKLKENSIYCASLFKGIYFNLPNAPDISGMCDSVNKAVGNIVT